MLNRAFHYVALKIIDPLDKVRSSNPLRLGSREIEEKMAPDGTNSDLSNGFTLVA